MCFINYQKNITLGLFQINNTNNKNRQENRGFGPHLIQSKIHYQMKVFLTEKYWVKVFH